MAAGKHKRKGRYPPVSFLPILTFKLLNSQHFQKSRSSRVGLIFPVARIHRMLREGQYAKRISSGAPIFMAAGNQLINFVFNH